MGPILGIGRDYRLEIHLALDKPIITKKEGGDDDDDEGGSKKKSTKDSKAQTSQSDSSREAAIKKPHLQPTASLKSYEVRLYFAAPSRMNGIREFDVQVQDQEELKRILLDPSATSSQQVMIHEWGDVAITDKLKLQLIPVNGRPVLNGIEITRKR